MEPEAVMTIRRFLVRAGFLAAWIMLTTSGQAAESATAPLLARIKAVGSEGAGNPDAAKAWRQLIQLGPDVIPDVLHALSDAGPVAANWLRAAVDAIAEQALADKRPLPAAKLEAFVKQTAHAGPARRLAYEWLCRVDPAAPDRL